MSVCYQFQCQSNVIPMSVSGHTQRLFQDVSEYFHKQFASTKNCYMCEKRTVVSNNNVATHVYNSSNTGSSLERIFVNSNCLKCCFVKKKKKRITDVTLVYLGGNKRRKILSHLPAMNERTWAGCKWVLFRGYGRELLPSSLNTHT